ncbi:MAG TPA: hypothetical protein VGO61_04915 [Steroidobacteraceae bacterium]|jgi:uncharacterized membrane protein|nr:hypothetical protein [Steroidobacteraceae bacterium]
MSSASSKWLLLALTVAYLFAAHLAFTRDSRSIAAIAMALLSLLLLAAVKSRGGRIALAVLAIVAVICVARGSLPPLPLLLPPILVPLGLAWLFGNTLRPGRIPLVERFARALHAPDALEPALVRYARRVNWVWTLLLLAIALANGLLAMNLSPGGLLELAGADAWWPISRGTFVWLGNTATYLLILVMFAGEFVVRVLRFPGYRFRNPADLVRRARLRMPSLRASLRRDD